MNDSPGPTRRRPSAESVHRLLEQVRADEGHGVATLLEMYRHYLLSIARVEVKQQLRPKLSPVDLVQETIAVALRKFVAAEVQSEEELRRWLRRLLRNKLKNHQRKFGPGTKRDLAREVPLESAESAIWLRQLTARDGLSPRGQIEHKQMLEQVERAIFRLPIEYRTIILWRNRDQRTFVEIGQELHRSPDAVRMLWKRALRALGKVLEDGDGSSANRVSEECDGAP